MNKNPPRMLDRFEEKHGTHSDLVAQLEADPNAPGQREVRRLLRRHSELVWFVMGYNIAKEEERKRMGG